MDECESLDSEVAALQGFQSEPSEAVSQDDEDELEELQKSLREVVQDQSVKPKVQCLMVDPSFSMVTVQSEDSGIVWETASSRCSTPWASETSSISEAYSMEGSGAAGKITVVFDEEKVVRRRTRSGGRSSRLGDRLSRPGSSRSASALGVERPEMAEVSIPNIKQEETEKEPDLEDIKSKDQQLFSLISEGYEILNIRVPSKLPTVDEEESTELQDNLTYLDQTPQIRSRDPHDWTQQQQVPLEEEEVLEPLKQDLTPMPADTELQKDSHIDYFEKFTLLDHVVPGKEAAELQKAAEEQPAVTVQVEKKQEQEPAKDSSPASEESFVFVTDVEIVGEHLDEVFYGEGPPADALQKREDEEEEARMRMRRESLRSGKSGSVLFEKEETTLTPIYISSGPPKIIDPILLEEPTAMSFMYSDLYEDAVGERRRSDEEYSEAESVASEKSYRRRLSDSDEADGYLEKFILKDETPTAEARPESVEDKTEGRMMWPQNKFDMTGCLIRADEEDAEEKKKTEEPEQKEDTVTGNERQETHLPTDTEEVEVSEKSSQDSKAREDQTEEISYAVIRDQRDALESRTDEKLEKPGTSEQHHSSSDCEQPSQAPEETATKAPVNTEASASLIKSEIQSETTEKAESVETVAEVKMAASDEKVVTETGSVQEPETEETLTSSDKETPSETFLCEEQEAADAAPEEVGPVEVIADCDSAVHAVIEVKEKAVREKEVQTQVHIDLKEITDVETADVREGDKGHEALRVEVTESRLPEFLTETDQESEMKAGISSGVNKPETPESISTDSHKKHDEIHQFEQHLQERSELITEAKAPEVSRAPVHDVMKRGDDLILLVPKGQAVEMDVSIGQGWDKTASVVVALPEPVSAQDDTAAHERPPVEETKPEPPLETEPGEEGGVNDLDRMSSAPASAVEAESEERRARSYVEGDEEAFVPLRSFTPQQDLFGLQREAAQSEGAAGEEEEESDQVEDAPEAKIMQEVRSDGDVHREDVGLKMEEEEAPTEAPEAPIELEYEVIYTQEAKDTAESEVHRDTEESGRESGLDREERVEVEVERAMELPPEEELNEDDYDIIDAEEESQARLAAELLGMDWFCVPCGRLLSRDDTAREDHHGHEVKTVDNVYEQVKEKLSDWISELQGKSENIEDLVSELELAYNSVEDLCAESDAAMKAQNEEMMSLVMEQYNAMSVGMEEEKKAKLEQLYDQIVSFQESIDSAKATLETASREADADACSPEDIYSRLKAALDSTMSLELGPKGLLVFEDYAKGNTSGCHFAQRKGIPVPQRPSLQPQEPGSATSTSVTVYWKVNPEDIIDCFQVYCMEDPRGAVSEEYRVTVKESYCVLEELEPDRKYKVWVMAVNYTGCSLPSERLSFTTAPSVPAIDTERCTVLWDSATLRWSSAAAASQTYTLEYCRQYELEGEGLRSVSGIRSCEHKVLLQPNENYLFYIKAVNEAGASEQSEAALVSTKGTRFRLLRATAHPALELSTDETTVHYSQDAAQNAALADGQCPSVLGELFPARGSYYWEATVSECAAYRLGVTCSTAGRSSSLGEDGASWCLQRVPSPSGCRYQLLHHDVQASVWVVDAPERVGTLLDYQRGRLSFYNAHSGQLLGSFSQRFTQPCRPALALEMPGRLGVRMVPELPEFARES
ncbi:cardiomyopathy-associated protein 5 [Betta splendens]|uniref:Cardiomyopathy-associated protein 5 n=1 Tax=Betta splendens TaxID=158456 RepID=A0A6P7NFX0_BETSP|nr:cardiomyopathy-associated protein 5 [Betta splendens]